MAVTGGGEEGKIVTAFVIFIILFKIAKKTRKAKLTDKINFTNILKIREIQRLYDLQVKKITNIEKRMI